MKKNNLEKEIIEKLDELNSRADKLIQLVAVSSKLETILKDKTKSQQIEILSNFGVSKEAIALIVDTTTDTVAVRISEHKKKAKNKKKRG
jgi:hypothetical protein